MLRRIVNELIRHAPFTASGALTGIIIVAAIVLGNVSSSISYTAFYILHPAHILLSAVVTTAMYRKYTGGKVWTLILIGYAGSIGIGTLSDAIIPFLGGAVLSVEMEFHIPFIEAEKMPVIGIQEWQLINSAAFIGIILGYFKPNTKFPHSGHILLSTWASLFYLTAFGTGWLITMLPLVLIFLFLAVWVPCCTSDIVFPLLFVRKRLPPAEHMTYNQHHLEEKSGASHHHPE